MQKTQSTESIFTDLREFREKLDEDTIKTINSVWEFWVSNSIYISKVDLIFETENRYYLERLLNDIPTLIQEVDYCPTDFQMHGKFVQPTILGLLCIDVNQEIYTCLSLLIELAARVFSKHRNTERIPFSSIEKEFTATPERDRIALHSSALLPGWEIRQSDGNYSIYMSSDIIDVATNQLSAREYIANIIESYLSPINNTKQGLILDYIVWDIFFSADKLIRARCPLLLPKIESIKVNLGMNSIEAWSNSVHSIRRLLQILADTVYPPSNKPRSTSDGREIAVGAENYINRLVCYTEDRSSSNCFTQIVGSHLKYLGERLDAVFDAAHKGSHTDILSREEAERYLIYAYLLIRDILLLES